MNSPTLFYNELLSQSGKSAIAVRGIVECFLSGETKLRKCQEAAAALAEELGAPFTGEKNSTASRMARLLRDAEVFQQLDHSQKKTGYVLEADHRLPEFAVFLEENVDYGTRIRGSHEEDMQRLHLLQHLEEHGSVRANNITNKIPSKAYKLLGEKMMRGELDVIYVPAGAKVGVKHNGQTEIVDYYVD